MQRYYKFLIVLPLMLVFLSCERNRYDVDVSHIRTEIEIKRFDRELASLDISDYREGMKKLRESYPEMYLAYVEGITHAGLVEDSNHVERLKKFIFDKYTQELYEDVLNAYADVAWLEKDLTQAFRHYRYYYPQDTIPEVYTVVSNFYFGAGTFENLMFISLDLFLGADYGYYSSLFPHYMIRFFRPEYIKTEAMKALFGAKFPIDSCGGEDLLSQMIYEGKRLFFLDLMLPNTHDSIKIRYSEKELKWCNKHEGEIWNQILKNEVLFETDDLKFNKYLDDSPFTNAPGIPQDSPPRLGEWLGWQIVRKYAEQFELDQVTEIFGHMDAQEILRRSAYKPKL